ncbi:MAG: GDP-L-fucose synthase [Candidatus Aminicenantes bacterium]|nr:GDP-L-fucose synthase [Candidatus Aminicenantes bacterium]
MNIKEKNITVTGGRGFLGKHLVRKLKAKGWRNVYAADLPDFDLRRLDDILRMYNEQKLDIVIHLAAVVGGIGANQKSPGRFFYENAIMGILLLHQAFLHQIEKFVALGTVCCYPKNTPVPFKEEHLWNGYPEETNAPYGLAKKMLLVQSQAYRKEHGFNSIFLMPANIYGPGDNCDLQSSHVIPALIRKCIEAKENGIPQITVWGTGKASREFLYVEDAAEAISLAMEKYDKSDPVNIGTGREISIKDLVKLICRMTGYKGRVVWDSSKTDGQPRRMLNTQKAEQEFGFNASTNLEQGLKRTIDWYQHFLRRQAGHSY